jgi:protein TonB
MKLTITSLFLLFRVSVVFGETSVKDTNSFAAIEPQYPGGVQAFNNYITRKLHYPDAARLICINGKVFVSFVVDKDGSVKDVTPLNCVGAGCESEAVKVVRLSKQWKPGFQNGEPVSVTYTISINFNMESTRVYMDNLRASDYGFVFEINGELCSLSEAYRMLGKSFSATRIESAEPFVSQNNDQKFLLPNKKITYLLIIKSNRPS